MQAVRETTKWESDFQPNHVYLLDGNTAIAYMPWGKDPAVYFKNPFPLNLSGRKFEKLKNNPFTKEVEETRRRVEGTNGSVYWVDDHAQTCTCQGFIFRGTCKHLNPSTPSSPPKEEKTTTPPSVKGTKVDAARRLFNEATDKSRAAIIKIFVDQLGMSKAAASTYFYNVKGH